MQTENKRGQKKWDVCALNPAIFRLKISFLGEKRDD